MPLHLSVDRPQHSRTLSGDTTGPLVRRSVLPGGVRLLTEADHSVRSLTLGLWLPVGSRDEREDHAGSTHALEHLLFKGTRRRSALDIATAFDAVGGESNAATTKEHTLYHGRVRSADLPIALDVLADMITSCALDGEALTTEKEVILEELAMAQDDPTDCGYEQFLAQVLGPDTPLGRPVGGTARTVTDLDASAVRAHYQDHYVPENLVVTAVGDIDHDELERMLVERLRAGGWELDESARPSPRRAVGPDAIPDGRDVADLRPERLVRELEQTHIYLGGPALSATSEDRHAMNVLMAVLGGGVSSRLFQHVREQRGLAYSVFSFNAGYRDAGVFGMYAACRPSRAEQVVELLGQEVTAMRDDGVTEQEMSRVRGQISGTLALGLEDTASRMVRLGTMELVHGQYVSVDEAMRRIDAVSAQEVRDLAARLADSFTTRVDVGPAA